MGQMKHYLNNLISESADNVEQQDAIEYAIYSGWVKLTYNIETDKATIAEQLAQITTKFRRIADENAVKNSPLLELVGQISDYK